MFKFGTGLLKTIKFLLTLTEDTTSSFFVMADNKSKSIVRLSALSLDLLRARSSLLATSSGKRLPTVDDDCCLV